MAKKSIQKELVLRFTQFLSPPERSQFHQHQIVLQNSGWIFRGPAIRDPAPDSNYTSVMDLRFRPKNAFKTKKNNSSFHKSGIWNVFPVLSDRWLTRDVVLYKLHEQFFSIPLKGIHFGSHGLRALWHDASILVYQTDWFALISLTLTSDLTCLCGRI